VYPLFKQLMVKKSIESMIPPAKWGDIINAKQRVCIIDIYLGSPKISPRFEVFRDSVTKEN